MLIEGSSKKEHRTKILNKNDAFVKIVHWLTFLLCLRNTFYFIKTSVFFFQINFNAIKKIKKNLSNVALCYKFTSKNVLFDGRPQFEKYKEVLK
jgi:hypothetical protein